MSESPFSALVWGRPVDPSTIGGLSDARQIDLNLFYTIKEKILPADGYVTRLTETLTAGSPEIDQETGLQVTPYQASEKDWVYYNPDPSNPSLSGVWTVPTISVSGGIARMDYYNGIVYYSGALSNTIDIDYWAYSVKVFDGYPDWFEDPKMVADIKIPMVTIDLNRRDNNAFQIGGGYSQTRQFVIDIIGASDTQRDDILDSIEDALRYTFNQSIDYSFGFPIQFNGDRNLAFDRGPASKWKDIRFENTISRIIRNPFEIDKFRHRAAITLNILTYD